MSLMARIFGQQQPQQQVPTAAPNGPGNPAHTVTTMQQPSMTVNSDGHIPNLGNPDPNNPQGNPPQTKEPESPLAEFANIWTIEKPKEGDVNLDDPIRFNVDPAKVKQQVSKIDFTKSITPELLAKINAGGPEATAALLTAMNQIGQEALTQASLINTRMLETGLETSRTRTKEQLPGLVRNQTISQMLREDNPLFSDPATAPLLEAVQSQLASKFPNATAKEIQEHARKFMVGFAQKAADVYNVEPNGSSKNKQANANIDDYDWSKEPLF